MPREIPSSVVPNDGGQGHVHSRDQCGDANRSYAFGGNTIALRTGNSLDTLTYPLGDHQSPGIRWFDPAAPNANGVRIDQGSSGAAYPSQQVDHVIVRSGGKVLGPDGVPITGPSGRTFDITASWGVDYDGTVWFITAFPTN